MVRLGLNNCEMSDGRHEIRSGSFHTSPAPATRLATWVFKKKIAVEGTTGPSQQLPARNPTSGVRPGRNAGPCSPGDPQPGQLGTGLTAPRGRRPPCAPWDRGSAPRFTGKTRNPGAATSQGQGPAAGSATTCP